MHFEDYVARSLVSCLSMGFAYYDKTVELLRRENLLAAKMLNTAESRNLES
jgi:hypothetical protein